MADEFISNTDMEVVHREVDFPNSRTPSRGTEPSGRRGVKDNLRPLRLDDSSTSILQDIQETGSIGGGLVCILPDTPAPLVFQLETGSSRRGNRCLHSGLEPTLGICQPSMVSVIDYTSKDPMRESHSGSSYTYMEDTTMVSSPTPIIERVSSPDPNARECGHITNSGGVYHANRSTSVGCMDVIWQQCQSVGLSEGASRLLESSWRDTTRSTYDSLFKQWSSWCQGWGRDLIRGPIADVSKFLVELFEEGYQY